MTYIQISFSFTNNFTFWQVGENLSLKTQGLLNIMLTQMDCWFLQVQQVTNDQVGV